MTKSERPEDRVRAYLDAIGGHNLRVRASAGGWEYGNTVHGFNQHELLRSDLRDLLLALDSARGEIQELRDKRDMALDMLRAAGFRYGSLERIMDEGDAPQGDPITSTTD